MIKTYALLCCCLLTFNFVSAQITCILCYDQNDSISAGVTNLLQNGSFESGCITGSFCPVSVDYDCDIPGWVCTGGGTDTYAQVFDQTGSYYSTYLSEIYHGNQAAYLGNFFCTVCPGGSANVSCLNYADCTVMSLPAGYPTHSVEYGGSAGVTISQDVAGLIVGDNYVLEFWAGGEYDSGLEGEGMFAVNVGFGDTLLTCKPTGPGQVGTTYIIQFIATSSTQTISFTNWGHIAADRTEIVLDNVRLYTLAELSQTVPSCAAAATALDFSISDSTICEKLCVDYFDASTNNPTSWYWIFPGGTPPFSNDQNPTNICYNTAGTYDATLITNGLNGPDTLALDDVIAVYAMPSAVTITQSGNTLSTNVASSYQWQFNTVDIAGATNQTYEATQNGSYTVVVSNENGCTAGASIKVAIDGIDDLIDGSHVSVFPNPSDGIFYIELSGLSQIAGVINVHVSVSNGMGQVVMQSNGKTNNGIFAERINLKNACDGLYVLTVTETDEHGKNGIVLARKKIIVNAH